MTPEMRQRALRLLGRVEYVALIAVVDELKPAMRVEVSEDRIPGVRELARELGLACEVSAYALVAKSASGNIKHGARAVPAEEAGENADYFVYLSRAPLDAKLASVMDNRDDRHFGQLMGYPDCCVEFFDRVHDRVNYDKVYQVEDPPSGRYDPLIYYACRGMGHSLIFHFPCRWDCEASTRIAGEVLEALRGEHPALAEQVWTCLDSDMFYSPHLALALKHARVEGRRVVPGEPHACVGEWQGLEAFDFSGDRVRAMAGGEVVRHFEQAVWLPFHSQQRVDGSAR